jgi:hypothetical protein
MLCEGGRGVVLKDMRDVECAPWPIVRCVVSVAICVVRVVGMTVRFEVR